MSKVQGNLYLLPTTLGGDKVEDVLPPLVIEITRGIRNFVVEEVRTARRYLSKLGMPVAIDQLNFEILNEHTSESEIEKLVEPMALGLDVGLLSEAGVPAIADPGSKLVALSHKRNIKVIPLSGPCSIVMALMSSGLNGQNFSFLGYLPVKPNERESRIRQLEKRSKEETQTQLFIETPYRNNQLMQSLLRVLHPETLLHISCDLTMESEYVKTMRVWEWKNNPMELNKRPTIFGILAL